MQPYKIDDVVEKLRTLPPERIAEVADFIDFLQQRVRAKNPVKREPLNFPLISVGQWPDDLSLRREAMYGDDGR